MNVNVQYIDERSMIDNDNAVRIEEFKSGSVEKRRDRSSSSSFRAAPNNIGGRHLHFS